MTTVAELKRDKPVDFEAEILPVLRRNCLACHSGSKAEDHLVLETPQSIRVARYIGRKDFDGNIAAQARVAGAIDLSHAA